MRVYCAGPVAGMTVEQVKTRHALIGRWLSGSGHTVIFPVNQAEMDTACADGVISGDGDPHVPAVTDKALFERDKWWVQGCDILYADLSHPVDHASIGSMFEIAWADILGKHVVICKPKDDGDDRSVYHHPFVYSAGHVIFSDPEKALAYIAGLR